MGSQSASSVVDKRRRRPRDESATEFLRDFPALLALSRLAVPILAVDDTGEIEFANEAFAAMVGYSPPSSGVDDRAIPGGLYHALGLRGGRSLARARRLGHPTATRGWLDHACADQRLGVDPRKGEVGRRRVHRFDRDCLAHITGRRVVARLASGDLPARLSALRVATLMSISRQ